MFITEKWCDGNPNMGLTNHYHNIFSSLNNTEMAEDIIIGHFDEIYYENKIHIDSFMGGLLDENSPDVVVVSFLGTHPTNPTKISFDEMIKRGIKTVVKWPDTRDWACDLIKSMDYVDLHVSWCSEAPDDEILGPNHIWMWSPEDETLYFEDIKTTDVSFIGSIGGYANVRKDYIDFLLSKGIKVITGGGQRENKLSPEEYARLIRKSRININFSSSAKIGTHQCKGRVFESLASGTLLLESKNECTRRRFTPGKHYVEFDSPESLLERVKYFIENNEEREIISNNGYTHYVNNYSAKNYWGIIFDRLWR